MRPNKPKYISDDKLKKIPISECGEPFVNIRNYSEDIVIDVEAISRKFQALKDDECYVRKSVAERLVIAQRILPQGHKLMIHDGFRPLAAQKWWWNKILADMKRKHPKMSDSARIKETAKWIAPLDLPPAHSTGGAVDLTIARTDGKSLDMGTKLNAVDDKSITSSAGISKQAQRNRRLLCKVMTKAGFVNYPLEWWHWSYGDKYWAAINKTHAIYAQK